LQIPGVGEQDIRVSLLKGELYHKILAQDIVVISSDIDLLQFNNNQKSFLQSAGVVNGLQVSSTNMNVLRKDDVQLVGSVNNINTVFKIPGGTFIYNSTYKIIVYIAESGGVGSGYDSVIFTVPPTTLPSPADIITADYYVYN
jgi:multimeric flavodoxin WrbA